MKYLLLAALVFCFGMLDSLYARIDEQVVAEADQKARAAHYAAVIAGCLNGDRITIDGKPVVRCWRVK